MRRVEVAELHDLDLSPAGARRLQQELAPEVEQGPSLDPGGVRYVAGVDVSIQGDRGYAAAVVLSYPDLEVVEARGAEAELNFPYVSGLLAMREIPPVADALREVQAPVDAVIFDSQGVAHPRRMGLASHLGLYLSVPSVGCAKTRLCGTYEDPGREKGSAEDLVHRGEVVGRVLRTRTGVSPVYVSAGHRIDLPSAVDLTLASCTRYRLPEPTRQAHLAANRLRRGEALL